MGLTEREARGRGFDVKAAKVPASVVPRARTLGETRGFLKAVVDARSDQILGFAMLGAEAGEVTATVQTSQLSIPGARPCSPAAVVRRQEVSGTIMSFGTGCR